MGLSKLGSRREKSRLNRRDASFGTPHAVGVPAIRRGFAGMDGSRRDDEDAAGGSRVPSSFELEASGPAVDARDDPVVVHVRCVSVPYERRMQCFDARQSSWPKEACALFQRR